MKECLKEKQRSGNLLSGYCVPTQEWGEERRSSLQPPWDEIVGQAGNRDRLTLTGDTEEHEDPGDGLGHRYC